MPSVDAVEAGTIAIIGDCSATYRNDGYGWGPLERKVGEGHSFKLTGAIGADLTTLISSEGWSFSAKRTSAGVVFVRSDFDTIVSEPVDIPEGDITLDVIVDPNPIGAVSVSLNGNEIFYSFAVDAIDVVPGATWLSDQTPAAFCESLLKRFGS